MAFAVMDKNKDNNAPCQMKMDGQHMKGEMGPRMDMMETLKLTDDQKKQMQTMLVGHKKDMNTMQADLENLQIDKKTFLSAQKFDDAKKVVDQINSKQATMEKSGIEFHKQMWNLLTDEQKKIAKEHKMDMGMMGDRPGPGPMNGQMGPKNHKMGPKNMQGCESGNCSKHGEQCK